MWRYHGTRVTCHVFTLSQQPTSFNRLRYVSLFWCFPLTIMQISSWSNWGLDTICLGVFPGLLLYRSQPLETRTCLKWWVICWHVRSTGTFKCFILGFDFNRGFFTRVCDIYREVVVWWTEAPSKQIYYHGQGRR